MTRWLMSVPFWLTVIVLAPFIAIFAALAVFFHRPHIEEQ